MPIRLELDENDNIFMRPETGWLTAMVADIGVVLAGTKLVPCWFTERPSDAFVFTTTHANWVNLGFNFGSQLPDNDDLLRGEGKSIRHVRIAQTMDLNSPGVRELVRAAIAQAERPEGKARKPRTVLHTAQSARKRSAPNRRRT